MKMNLKVLITLTLISGSFLLTQRAFAGGSAPDPRYERIEMIHCHAVNANEKVVRELTYNTVITEGSAIETGVSNIVLKGDLFEVIIAGGKDLSVITQPTDQPIAFHPQNGVEAYKWNVRSIDIKVSGNHLSLSMIAGALGQNKVTNLKMTCSAAQD